jgi:hypothetical protein
MQISTLSTLYSQADHTFRNHKELGSRTPRVPCLPCEDGYRGY